VKSGDWVYKEHKGIPRISQGKKTKGNTELQGGETAKESQGRNKKSTKMWPNEVSILKKEIYLNLFIGAGRTHPQLMEVPGPGIESEPQLQQHRILNLLCQAGDQTCASAVTRAAAETTLDTSLIH